LTSSPADCNYAVANRNLHLIAISAAAYLSLARSPAACLHYTKQLPRLCYESGAAALLCRYNYTRARHIM
jgi:hypothetical protein